MMSYQEVLKVVFPLLDGKDLASCMQVCKQWRDIARDGYFWKCLCAKRWPSICKRPTTPPVSYQKLFQMFSKRHRSKTLPPPRLSFDNLEFYIDIWAEERVIFSEVVPGSVLRDGIKDLPPCEMLRFHLESPDYKMIIPVEPKFSIPLCQTISVSVLVGRSDTNKVACIVYKSLFDYIDRTAYRALAFDYLEFSPEHPFISGIRAWVSLLFMEDGGDGLIDVFGIELDFCDVANSEEKVLWLLDMLDWK
ncbi:F-box protein At5g39250-like [Telopea speciosissima]|uniref:F-box protein At5g39250-like n=1 Tax=Telopea speciosissima TaxID=54955 RepID=UPI001CC5C389|nr:F-box protein At5g39250-like [Telopea speciosissima]